MANYFLPKAYIALEKNSFSWAPVTLSVEHCCEHMGISRATFYRRQEQRRKAQRRILDGENSPELYEMLSFPELLSDVFGSRTFVRYADIISWSEQLKGRTRA
ncbi:hypothetical protein [Paraperlucidibaca sp.]|uniref:hypothetical protein n=1 Tax=Paraperlucidibaca sp. TaxID=2708021 RepID=UPI0030F38792